MSKKTTDPTNCYLVVHALENRVLEIVSDWQSRDYLALATSQMYNVPVYAVRAVLHNSKIELPDWQVTDKGADGTFIKPLKPAYQKVCPVCEEYERDCNCDEDEVVAAGGYR